MSEHVTAIKDKIERTETIFTKWALFALLGSTSCVFWFISSWIYPVLKPDVAIIEQLFQVSTTVMLDLVVVLIWMAAKDVYFSSLAEIKILVVDATIALSFRERATMRKEINQRIKKEGLGKHIAIRYVDPSLVITKDDGVNFSKKYRFNLVAWLEEDKDKNIQYRLMVLGCKNGDKEWYKTTMSHLKQMNGTNSVRRVEVNMGATCGHKILDSIVLITGVTLFLNGEYNKSLDLVKSVDESCQRLGISVDAAPRKQIRWLCMQCFLCQMAIKTDQIEQCKDPQVIADAIKVSETAFRYDESNFSVALNLARLYFLSGELPKAMDMVMKASKNAKSDPDRVLVSISSGFLACLNGKYESASVSYRQLVDYFNRCPQAFRDGFDWNDLVQFTFIAKEQGYPHLIIPLVLYLRAAKSVVSFELIAEAHSWLGEDETRFRLTPFIDLKWSGGVIEVKKYVPPRKKKVAVLRP